MKNDNERPVLGEISSFGVLFPALQLRIDKKKEQTTTRRHSKARCQLKGPHLDGTDLANAILIDLTQRSPDKTIDRSIVRKKRTLSPTPRHTVQSHEVTPTDSDDDEDWMVNYNPMSNGRLNKSHRVKTEAKPTIQPVRSTAIKTSPRRSTAGGASRGVDFIMSYNPLSTRYSSLCVKTELAPDSKPPPRRVTPMHDEASSANKSSSSYIRREQSTATDKLTIKPRDLDVAHLPPRVTPTWHDDGDSSDSFPPCRLSGACRNFNTATLPTTPSDDDRKPKAKELIIELIDSSSSEDEAASLACVSPAARTPPKTIEQHVAGMPSKCSIDCAMSSNGDDDAGHVEVEAIPSKFIFDIAMSSDDDDDGADEKEEEMRHRHDDLLDRDFLKDEASDSSSEDGEDIPRVTMRGRRRTLEDVRADIQDRIDQDSEDEDGDGVRADIPLTEQHKVDELADIEKLEDKAYQILLWKEGFRMTLLPHQFLGSRAVAGLPEKFPCHAEKLSDPNQATMERAIRRLPESKTRGLLLADDMGLGKTIQAISGSIMHSAVLRATNQPVRPTLIISPNVALIEQWILELKRNGVKSRHILYIRKRQKIGTKAGFRHQYIFMTRYTLASETKDILHQCANAVNPQRQKSSLFPDYTVQFYSKMWRLKRGSEGKFRDRLRRRGETYDDCLTRLVKLNLAQKPKATVFGLVVIDEAHFLKNRVSFWGIGAAMLGVHADRTITMTGTPYCNNASDVAALQTYIDIKHEAAKTKWWEKATGDIANAATVEKVSEWRDQYLVRRRKEVVLKDVLKDKIISEIQVQCYPRELQVYDLIEGKLKTLMEQFAKKSTNPQKEKEMQDIMMALMTLARGCLVHPIIPNGREVTIMFSPSRRGIPVKSPEICVYCNQMFRPTVPLVKTVGDENYGDDGESDEVANGGPDLNWDLEGSDIENDDDIVIETGGKKKNLGKLIRFSAEFCGKTAQDEEKGHLIHEKCLESFHEGVETRCARCIDLENRTNLQNCIGQSLVPHKRYCTHIQPLPNVSGGFVASSKIERVLAQFANVPKGEKVLVLSFFKGVLDLLEGIFVEEMGIGCARYDGDMNHEDRKMELGRFQDKTKSCRVLLSTVHVCGTGLNIVEANHVFFVDRWFNPTVHDQAMDRCYRIGQTKDVFVSFFDCVGTIDIGMMLTNKHKKMNSAILLADGTDLGDGNMSFRQLQGVMRNLIAAQQKERIAHVEALGREAPFTRVTSDTMAELMARVAQMSEDARKGRRSRNNRD